MAGLATVGAILQGAKLAYDVYRGQKGLSDQAKAAKQQAFSQSLSSTQAPGVKSSATARKTPGTGTGDFAGLSIQAAHPRRKNGTAGKASKTMTKTLYEEKPTPLKRLTA